LAQGATNVSQNYVRIQASTNLTGLRKPVSALSPATNRVGTVTNQFTGAPVERTVRVVPGGARADFGRHTLSIAADAAASRPITITTPSGRTLSCRPSFIALYNAKSGQSLLLGAVTNRIGTVVLPATVWWTNCFDTIRADLRVIYTEHGVESDVLLRENVGGVLPTTWRPEDVRLEIWCEWFNSAPASKRSKPSICGSRWPALRRFGCRMRFWISAR
jgi:hypothetical protein